MKHTNNIKVKNKLLLLFIIIISIATFTVLNRGNLLSKVQDTKQNEEEELNITYEKKQRSADYTKIGVVVKISGSMGIEKIIKPDGLEIYPEGKNEVYVDLLAENNVDYKYTVKGKGGKEIQKTINIILEPVINYITKDQYVYNITTSSNLNSSTSGQKIFDNSINAFNGCWHSKSLANQWLQIEFINKVKIKNFTIKNRPSGASYPTYAITNFTLQGSNDGTEWINIQDFKNPSTTQKITEFEVIYTYDSEGFKYYRWYANYTGYVTIGELEINLIGF